MTDTFDPSSIAAHEQPPSVGAELRGAREGAGLSIEDVAQQLKLAPRQVQALEDDDYAKLPGRTFVRGFVRNYARALGLDADELVARLPGGEPSLERPTITPSGRPMGALPAAAATRRNWARWAIPLLLVAIVGAAGVYELRRPQADARRASTPDKAPAPATSVTTAGGTTSATLPNPLADAPTDGAASASSTPGAVTPPVTTAEPAVGASPTAPAASAPGAATGAPATAAGASAATTPTGASGEPLLVLTFKASSWVQVKDRNGTVLLAQNGQAGTTQAIAGPLPLDIVVGNANDVSATFRGQPLDLAPFVRGNVARLSLK